MKTKTAHKLIADIDPALAALWLRSPFQRHNIVTAFHASLVRSKIYAHLADEIATFLRATIDADQLACQWDAATIS